MPPHSRPPAGTVSSLLNFLSHSSFPPSSKLSPHSRKPGLSQLSDTPELHIASSRAHSLVSFSSYSFYPICSTPHSSLPTPSVSTRLLAPFSRALPSLPSLAQAFSRSPLASPCQVPPPSVSCSASETFPHPAPGPVFQVVTAELRTPGPG